MLYSVNFNKYVMNRAISNNMLRGTVCYLIIINMNPHVGGNFFSQKTYACILVRSIKLWESQS